MPGTFDQRIANIESKARLLAERHRYLMAQRDQALEQIDRLQAQLADQNRQIENLKAQVDYLRMAATIAPSRDEIDRSRQFLSQLVWEIDKCINQLSD